MTFDEVDGLTAAQAQTLGGPDEIGRGRGGISVSVVLGGGDERTSAALRADDAHGLQLAVGARDGVDRETHLGGQRAHRGESLARREIAGCHRRGDLLTQLLERRSGRVGVDRPFHGSIVSLRR